MSNPDPLNPVSFRGPTPDDLNFILSSWLKSFRFSEFARDIPPDIYFRKHKILVQDILARSMVTIAHSPDEPDHIFGYLVFEPSKPVLHYIYVKHIFRNLGFAKQMILNVHPAFGEEPTLVSHNNFLQYKDHATNTKVDLKQKFKLIYDPYLTNGAK